MDNLGSLLSSTSSDMLKLLNSTSSKVDDGNGPDGVYRSHLLSIPSPNKIMIKPTNSLSAMKIQRIEMAFGCTSWQGNTSPASFSLQYTNDQTAKVEDDINDGKWTTLKQYTSWSNLSGMVTLDVDFSCRLFRLVVNTAYQGNYFNATIFRLFGAVRQGAILLIEDEQRIYSYTNGEIKFVGNSPVTETMFSQSGFTNISAVSQSQWRAMTSPKILAYSVENYPLTADLTVPKTLYDPVKKCYIGIGEIVTPLEILPAGRKQLILTADYIDCTFSYSLDSGTTWTSMLPDQINDISSMIGNALVIKVTSTKSTSRLNAISYAWS